MSLKGLLQSFRDAARGIGYTFKSEQNFRLQILVAAVAVVLMLAIPLRNWEQILVLLLILMVLSMELLNTAVEKFSDLLVPRLHQQISVIKDVMAAAVFITSLGAAVIGVMIFWPYLADWIK